MAKITVFKPAIKPNSQEIPKPTLIDKPDYPDVGVAFAGYSKTPLGGNDYKLNTQTPKNDAGLIIHVGGTVDNVIITPTNKFFLKQLWFSRTQLFAGAMQLVLRVNSDDIFSILLDTNNYLVTPINFDIPLALTSPLTLRIVTGGGVGQYLYYSYSGWVE